MGAPYSAASGLYTSLHQQSLRPEATPFSIVLCVDVHMLLLAGICKQKHSTENINLHPYIMLTSPEISFSVF